MKSFTSKSEKETIDLAASFAQKLKGGEALGLIGDLGSGKTVFTKGLASGLGIKKSITSPTFNIMKIYDIPGAHATKIKQLCHIDAYRINEADLRAIGAEDYINNPNCVIVVEWADRICTALPKDKMVIRFTLGKGENIRSIKFNY